MGTFYYVFVESTLDYTVRMLPGLLGAVILYFVLRPWRMKRLGRSGQSSSRAREGALLWRGFTWRRALCAGFAITLSVECWQLAVGRAFDVSDILLNTLGVLCGYWAWRTVDRLFPRLTAQFHVIPSKETL